MFDPYNYMYLYFISKYLPVNHKKSITILFKIEITIIYTGNVIHLKFIQAYYYILDNIGFKKKIL